MAPRRTPAPPAPPAEPPGSPLTPDGQQASVVAIEAAAAAAPQDDYWSTLAAPVAMESKTTFSGIKANVLSTVPEPIRVRAEQSLAINTKRVAAKASSSAARPRVNYHYDLQQVADREMGEKFDKLINKYAKYRPAEGDIPHEGEGVAKGQVTCRTGVVAHYRKTGDDEYEACNESADGAFLALRFSVRPFEQRSDTARVPGSTS